MIRPWLDRNAEGRWAVSVTGRQCWLSKGGTGLGGTFPNI